MINLINDEPMWNIWLGRMDLPALGVADTINLFAYLERGHNTVTQLAEALALDEKGIDALTTFLTSMCLLTKTGNKVDLTDLSKNYLLRTSPSYWGPALVRSKDSSLYDRILQALQSQKNSQLKLSNKDLTEQWQAGEISYEDAKQFTATMHATIFSAATYAVTYGTFDTTKALLDVGAGSGCFTTLFLKRYPTCRSGIFELPEVCRVTKEYLSQEEIFVNVDCHTGNFFTDSLPNNYDGILFSNILHDWSIEVAKILVKKAYDALPVGGRIFIHEMLLNEEKDGPKIPAAFNLLMYINHNSQQFTESELFSVLREAGFSRPCVKGVHSLFSIIVAEK